MAEIKRHHIFGRHTEEQDGEWIRYTDHIAALEAVKDDAEHERLMRASAIPTPYPRAGKSNLEAVKAELDRQHTLHDNLNRKYEGVCAKLELAEERVEAVKATNETTDQGFPITADLQRHIEELGETTEIGMDIKCAIEVINSLGTVIVCLRKRISALVPSPALEANQQQQEAEKATRDMHASARRILGEKGVVRKLREAQQGWALQLSDQYLVSMSRANEIVAMCRDAATTIEANQQVIETLRAALEVGSLTVSSGGHEFANVTVRFWSTKEAQDCHAALLALFTPTQDEVK